MPTLSPPVRPPARSMPSLLLGSLLCLAAGLSLSPAARAEGGKHATSAPLLPAYKQECGACHVAYPPGLLPAASWQRLSANLPRHFGVDASLDPATTKTLADWLAAHAPSGLRAGTPPPEDRITRSTWFVREHDEVPASTWKLPAVKSAALCAACHTQAEQGDFSERNIRIPR